MPLWALTNWSAETFALVRHDPDYAFLDRFRQIFVSGELRLIKPDPAIYRHVLDDIGAAGRELPVHRRFARRTSPPPPRLGLHAPPLHRRPMRLRAELAAAGPARRAPSRRCGAGVARRPRAPRVALLLAGALVWLARASLPQLAGELAVAGPRRTGDGRARRARGSRMSRQQSEADAYLAMGFLHGQDRLWQMEFDRLAGQGRLAEVLGEAGPAAPTASCARSACAAAPSGGGPASTRHVRPARRLCRRRQRRDRRLWPGAAAGVPAPAPSPGAMAAGRQPSSSRS